MFRDIFNGKPPRLFATKSLLENAETTLEMHYITHSGSIEVCDEVDTIEEKRWSEDPLLGK